jgi:hypothetical protein
MGKSKYSPFWSMGHVNAAASLRKRGDLYLIHAEAMGYTSLQVAGEDLQDVIRDAYYYLSYYGITWNQEHGRAMTKAEVRNSMKKAEDAWKEELAKA